MTRIVKTAFFLSLLALLVPFFSVGAKQDSAKAEVITIAINHNLPFTYIENGKLKGKEAEIVLQILDKAGIDAKNAQFVSAESPDRVIRMTHNGEALLGVGSLSTTAERNKLVDFTHSYMSSAIDAATHSDTTKVSTKGFFKTLGSTFVLVLLLLYYAIPWGVGCLWWLWLRARKSDKEAHLDFKQCVYETKCFMTTWGPSQRVLISRLNFVGIPVNLAGAVIIAFFTAYVTTEMGKQTVQKEIIVESDLKSKAIAVKAGTMSQMYAEVNGLRYKTFPSNEQAVNCVVDKVCQVVLADRSYLLSQASSKPLEVADLRIEQGPIAIAVYKRRGALLKALDQAVLEVREQRSMGDYIRKLTH
ncbi:MAG TPA: transporter substrate-binding domain-containing protein [Patescibacteria group bacterium]|nr:transporter substrate-binding domain-containing protein [Patescibacteria group bacterium]